MDETILILAESLRLDDVDTRLLAQKISATGWDPLLAAADYHRLGNLLALRLQQLGLIPSIPALRLPDGRLTIPAAIAERLDIHVNIRASQKRSLFELVAALNEEGIEPVLLKGSRSLWLESPDWRSMRDLDLLVRRGEVARAQKIAMRLGFNERDGVPLGHHHNPNLYRDDMPGWIEFHHQAGVSQLERLLSTRELLNAAQRVAGEAGRVYLLPPSLHVLHSMLHHHVGHWWDQHANNMSMKGLYEFAAETAHLNAEHQQQLVARAARHPRILAILDLWVAAASDLFGMAAIRGLTLQPDALAWWSKRRPQFGNHLRTPAQGLPDELAAATQSARLARVPHPILRHPWPAWIASRWSFVRRPRLLRIILRRAPTP